MALPDLLNEYTIGEGNIYLKKSKKNGTIRSFNVCLKLIYELSPCE